VFYTHSYRVSVCRAGHTQSGWQLKGLCGQLMGKALALITQSGEKFSCVAGRESFLVEPDQPFLLL